METDSRIHLQVETSHIVACGISDTGVIRPENEDSIWLDKSGNFLLLADGMGGHERGGEASKTAIKVIQGYLDPEFMKNEFEDITAVAGVPPEISCLFPVIDEAVYKANSVLYEQNQQLDLELYMGTTIVGLVIFKEDYVLWFHVGDSRIYRWRNSVLKCLTTDHSAYEEWLKNGLPGMEPDKNILTGAIGPDPIVQADTGWDKLHRDDTFILCSDGLTDMITDEQITNILKTETSVDNIANRLIDAANDAGGKDNTSVVVCRF